VSFAAITLCVASQPVFVVVVIVVVVVVVVYFVMTQSENFWIHPRIISRTAHSFLLMTKYSHFPEKFVFRPL
jgi:hypothetical protein